MRQTSQVEGIRVKIDFQLDGVKFELDFDDPDYFQSNGIERVLIRALYGDNWYERGDISVIRDIVNEKIVWNKLDEMYLSKEAMDYCDKLIKGVRMIRNCERCTMPAQCKPLRTRWFCDECYKEIRGLITHHQIFTEAILRRKGLI